MQKIGPYAVIETIGQGGMGVVYKAQDPVLDRIVAIKALHLSLLSEPEVVQRFLREAKTLAKFSHQNIVTLYTAIEEDDRFYLIMEYVEGETVKSMIDEKGALPIEECIGIILQTLQGVAYAHQIQVIHRDIKPANIIITPEGRAKITDFGIAKVAGDVQLTQVGLRIGTLRYMSPEQLNGQDSTYACDIYSLGVTFYEMLTGRVPFKADSQYELMRMVESESPPALKSFVPSVPDGAHRLHGSHGHHIDQFPASCGGRDSSGTVRGGRTQKQEAFCHPCCRPASVRNCSGYVCGRKIQSR
jgi:serine/threonine protein kinase